jgi:hypothetical protein
MLDCCDAAAFWLRWRIIHVASPGDEEPVFDDFFAY